MRAAHIVMVLMGGGPLRLKPLVLSDCALRCKESATYGSNCSDSKLKRPRKMQWSRKMRSGSLELECSS
jgi:hypothetical protein